MIEIKKIKHIAPIASSKPPKAAVLKKDKNIDL